MSTSAMRDQNLVALRFRFNMLQSLENDPHFS